MSHDSHRFLIAISMAATMAMAASCTPAAAQRVPVPAAEHVFSLTRPLFSGDDALATVAYMDDYFRVAGNTGFNGTIHRVEGILKKAGYIEETQAKPGTRLTYRIEHRPLRGPTWEPVEARVTIEGERSPLLAFETNRNMLAIYSASTPEGGVTAEVIDVGKATATELDRVPLTGKIAFAEGGVGQVFPQAFKRGAIGVMTYRMPAYTQPEIHRNSIQFGSIGIDSTRRGWGMPISRSAFDRLKAALAKGPARLHVDIETKMYPSEELTLVADVRGGIKPDERFVVSAHIQEPGANDNATGVGTLAEMARDIAVLMKNRSIDPARSITMLFGEETKQTRDYLAADSIRTRGVRWGLSLDMVGEDTKKTGGTFLIEKMPDPSAIWTRGDDKHSEWGGGVLTKDRLRPHYYNDYLLSRCLDQAATNGWVVKTNPFEGGSDHTPFLDFQKPAALFWHFTDVFYHTDRDRLVNVSAQTMTNVGNSALAAMLVLTSADGATARALVSEQERAAVARINTEMALSRQALAAGGDMVHETDIITTWIDYYAKAFETMTDIEVGGSSTETSTAIHAAAGRINAMKSTWGSK